MTSKSPHLIVVGLLLGVAHYTQVGTELALKVLPQGLFPQLGRFSEIAIAIAVWLFVFFLIPKACRLILAIYDWVGRVYDRAHASVKQKLVKAMQVLLEKLTQNGTSRE